MEPQQVVHSVPTEVFTKRVGELTKGEIEIQVFHDGQLGTSDPEQLESVISGAQGFFITGMEWFKAWDDRFGMPMRRSAISEFMAASYSGTGAASSYPEFG